MVSKLFNHNFAVRSLSAVVLVVVVLGSIWASPYTMLTLFSLICIGGMLEFFHIARLTGVKPLDTYPTILGVLLILMAFFFKLGQLPGKMFWCFVPAVFILFIVELYRKHQNPFGNIAWSLAGLIYIAIPFALLAYISVQGTTTGYILYHKKLIILIILLVWINDVGAYILGVTLGKHRLFERISPKKSWEGFFGGLIFTIGGGALFAHLFNGPVPYWAGAGAVISIAGVFGDLVESMLKRSVGLKDSGNIIPGHGGVLDRFDALIMAAPFLFVYFIIFAA